MKLTIAVSPKTADDDFSFGDLKLFHPECGGGVITTTYDKSNDVWHYLCKRCGVSGSLSVDSQHTIVVIQTALDGKSRKIREGTSNETAIVQGK